MEFAELIGRPLDPWQRWVVIHALELLPNGWPRFRQVLVLVARQNGKTELCVVLTLYWMFVLQVPLVLSTSTKLDYAKESWVKAYRLARSVEMLSEAIGGQRKTNGEQSWWTRDTDDPGAGDSEDEAVSRYKIGAANEEGGRSLTVNRLIEDELRQHHSWDAHEAAENAMNAVDDAQAWAISNAGSNRSVVLNSLQASALEFIEKGTGDDRLFLAEYSAPLGTDPTDIDGLAQANPNLGRRIDPANLLGKARRAKAAGGEQLTKFLTEVMCQQVPDMVPKQITGQAWAEHQQDVTPTGRPVFFVAIEGGSRSATIAVAADESGVPHVELAAQRTGTAWLTGRLKELHEKYPDSPIAAMAAGPVADLAPELTRLGIDIELLPGSEMTRACSHLEKLVSGRVDPEDDPGAPKTFTHSAETVVDLALAGMEVRVLAENTWTLNWKTSKGNLAPFAAEVGALWVLEKHREDDYDVLDSAY